MWMDEDAPVCAGAKSPTKTPVVKKRPQTAIDREALAVRTSITGRPCQRKNCQLHKASCLATTCQSARIIVEATACMDRHRKSKCEVGPREYRPFVHGRMELLVLPFGRPP